jgi:hypothetical protein
MKNSGSSKAPDNKPDKEVVASEGIEPKYIVALVVFLLACVYDKMVMHGGF